jgi:hypothetical protein
MLFNRATIPAYFVFPAITASVSMSIGTSLIGFQQCQGHGVVIC